MRTIIQRAYILILFSASLILSGCDGLPLSGELGETDSGSGNNSFGIKIENSADGSGAPLEDLDLILGESFEMFSILRESASATNIPVSWAMSGSLGSINITDGGKKVTFTASGTGTGSVTATHNGVSYTVDISVTNTTGVSISNFALASFSARNFEVAVNTMADTDTNATVTVYYCSETSTPGCDPSAGPSFALTRYGTSFEGFVTGLTAPYSPDTVLNILIDADDPGGVANEPTVQQLTLKDVTSVYRSVADSATAPLTFGTDGGTNNLTISQSVLTFDNPLANNIGVGDMIEIDTNNDGTLTAADTIAMIVERFSSTSFRVQTPRGDPVATMTTPDSDWRICRAYLGLDEATAMNENAGCLTNALEDFDVVGSGHQDLDANDEQMNFAVYGGGIGIPTNNVAFNAWNTTLVNNLKIYTPVSDREVGTSQRHSGVWDDNAGTIVTTADVDFTLVVDTDFMTVEGLQFDISPSAGTNANYGISFGQSGFGLPAGSRSVVKDNILRSTTSHSYFPFYSHSSNSAANYFVVNNIAYGFQGYVVGAAEGTWHLYNNTFYNNDGGIYNYCAATNVLMINNLVSGSVSTDDYVDGCARFDVLSANNLSSDASSPNVALRNQTINFVNPGSGNLLLSNSDTPAIGAGLDLSGDLLYPFDDDITGSLRGATWDIGASQALATASDVVEIRNLAFSSIVTDGFDVSVDFYADNNNSSSATFYYCNHTDSAGCDPLAGTSTAMVKGASDFTLTVSGLSSPNDPGDTLNVAVVATDLDGTIGSPILNQTVTLGLPPVTVLYRSLGYGNTNPLATGVGNALTISSGVASFEHGVDDNIGVGDVIQYDCDGDNDGMNSLDASDCVIIIHGRTNSQTYDVRTPTGATPANMAINDYDWQIYRAYTNYAGIGTTFNENTGIDSDIRDFDTYGVINNLVTQNTQMNIAVYADSTGSEYWTTNNWTTSAFNYLRIFAPASESEVGTSQRHTGKWDTSKATLTCTNTTCIGMGGSNGRYIRIEGLQFAGQGNGADYIISGGLSSVTGDIRIYNNIFYFNPASSGANNIVVSTNTGTYTIYNNILFGENFDFGFRSSNSSNVTTIYNNTVYGSNYYYSFGATGSSTVVAKNNVAQGSISNGFLGTFDALSTNNLSDRTDAPGLNPFNSRTVNFIDASNGDLRLASTDTEANGNGTDLSADPDGLLNILNDITFSSRNSPMDLGAANYFDNVGATSHTGSGEGTQASPYVIWTKDQLKDIGANGCNGSTSTSCDSYFRIEQNIDLLSEAFTPIGNCTNPFTGTFDGSGNQISNLNINLPTTDCTGFIGATDGAVVTNFSLQDGTVVGDGNTGGLIGFAGTNTSYISSIGVNSIGVTGNSNNVGGAIGGAYVHDSNGITVDGGVITGAQDGVGGIIGRKNGGSIKDSYAYNVAVSGDASVGGLIGMKMGGGGDDGVIAIAGSGSVTCTESCCGGAIGEMGSSTGNISLVESTASVRATGAAFGAHGGFIGCVYGSTDIAQSGSMGRVHSLGSSVGGFVGSTSTYTGTIADSWTSSDAEGDGEVGGFVGAHDGGTITRSTASGNSLAVTNNVGGFAGRNTTNGTITYSSASGDAASKPTGGTGNVGGFVGHNSGPIGYSTAAGSVSNSSDNSGGFMGLHDAGYVEKCKALGSVHGNDNVGGFVGSTTGGTTEYSFANGSVIGNDNVGGFVGSLALGSIGAAFSTGSVYGATDVGGFAGASPSGFIYDAYTISKVDSSNDPTHGFAFVGNLTGGTLTTNYWNSDAEGSNGSQAAAQVGSQYEPLTDSQLRSRTSLTGFDFTFDWANSDGVSFPVSRSMAEGQCVGVTTAGHTAIGSGTRADPHIICNQQQLRSFRGNCNNLDGSDCGLHFKLGADIDLKGDSFDTIGTFGNPFTGSLDGNFKTIYGYEYNAVDNQVGLFGVIQGGKVFNLYVKDSYLRSDSNRGTISGVLIGSQIINVHVEGDVEQLSSTRQQGGGLVGSANTTSRILSSSFAGGMDGDGSEIGGIIGWAGESSIHKSRSYISYSGSADNVGGIVGRGDSNNVWPVSVENVSYGVISASGDSIGGIGAGNTVAHESISFARITGSATDVGGVIAGYSQAYNSYNIAETIEGNDTVGGFSGLGGISSTSYSVADNINESVGATPQGYLGSGSSGAHTDGFWDSDLSGITTGASSGNYENRTTTQLMTAANFPTWDFIYTWAIGETVRRPMLQWDLPEICEENMTAVNYNDIGAGTPADPYVICFKEQFVDLGSTCGAAATGCGSHYVLARSVDLRGETITEIGNGTNAFTGTFDGKGKTLSNIVMTSGSAKVGLFGEILDAKITNLNIVDINVSIGGGNAVGTLVGFAEGDFMIHQVSVEGLVSGSLNIGGLIGVVNASTTGVITNSYANVGVSASGANIGGFIGGITAPIFVKNSGASGDVNGGDSVGGFVGGASNGTFIDNFASGHTTGSGTMDVGGFVGTASGTVSFTRNWADGNVIGSSATDVGGFIGESSAVGVTLTNNISTGSNVYGDENVGGFIGNGANGTLTRNVAINPANLNTGSVNGGFVAVAGSASYTENRWNSTVSGISTGGVATDYTALNDTQMQDQANAATNFTGWDFTNTWTFIDGYYPEPSTH